MLASRATGKRLLLVGGLGHTDLSGKVPRSGLLMLRRALRQAGHDAVVVNYSASLLPAMFPPHLVSELSQIYQRTIRPKISGARGRLANALTLPVQLIDLIRLQLVNQHLVRTEQSAFEELGRQIARQVDKERFDALGLPLYLGSSTIGAITVANIVRQELPNLPIIFGGPQTAHFAQTIYQATTAPTALAVGEAELSIVGFANVLDSLKTGQLSNLSRVPNLVYRAQHGQIVVTPKQRLPWQDWLRLSSKIYEAGDFTGVMKYAFIETSRGCPFLCRFCPEPQISGRERYLKPAPAVVDEMSSLNQQFGLTHFEFVGSTTPPHQAEEIADEISRRALDGAFNWGLFMRSKDNRAQSPPPPQLMAKLKKAGASVIFFGVEAADNATLRAMKKGATIEDSKKMMAAARQASLAIIASFIYPYPGMPPNEADLIVEFLRDETIRPLSAPVQPLGLYPGTYNAEHAAEIGCQAAYPDLLDQTLARLGLKEKPTMQRPEILRYLLNYRLVLSLPLRFWPPLPYKIDGLSYKQYARLVGKLQARIASLDVLTGFSHSHYLIAQVLGLEPAELAERMLYCSITGDAVETNRLIAAFNKNVR